MDESIRERGLDSDEEEEEDFMMVRILVTVVGCV